jgi:outer membrane protein
MPLLRLSLALFFLNLSSNIYAKDIGYVIDNTSKNNDNIKSQYAKLESIRSSYFDTISEFLPQIDLEYSKFNVQLDKTSANMKDDYDSKSYDLVLRQALYSPAMFSKLSSAKLGLEREVLQYQQLQGQVFLEAISTALQVYKHRLFHKFNQANLKLIKQYHDIAKIRLESGIINKMDFLKSKSQLYKAESLVLQSEIELDNEQQNYLNIVGVEYQNINLDKIKVKFTEKYKVIKNQILANNFQIKSHKIAENINKNNVKIARANYYPKADFIAKQTSDEGSYSFNTSDYGKRTTEMVGFEVSMPLFRSGANYAKLKKAKKELTMLEHRTRDKIKEINSKYENLWKKHLASNKLIQTHKKYYEFAKLALEAAQSQYKDGSKDITYFLDAKQEYLDAEYQYTNAKISRILNYFQLVYMKGDLLPNFFN